MTAVRRVLVGVSGGIASYKACSVVRQLKEVGAEVDVVMTAAAAEFVRPLTFEALSGHTVATSLWERGRALAHIDLGREANLIVVCPATANLLARAAQGIADDLLTALLLAREIPVLAAPAMNDNMFAEHATTANIAALSQRGWTFVGPAVGSLAEGPSERPGRMVEPEEIVTAAQRLLWSPGSKLCGKRILVTAGPTREFIDPVRMITNPSSGRMGIALARAAHTRGAEVTLIAGPIQLPMPYGVNVVNVVTTAELRDEVAERLPEADVLIMAAAPADYAPCSPAETKLPREDGPRSLSLQPTPDVLKSTAGMRSESCVTVGFALETNGDVDRARGKLVSKDLDLIVLNSALESGSGFESETNRVTLISQSDSVELPVLSKQEVADHILDRVQNLL
ncbi:MAG: bifunctional phosphopantothenoylcysteine decarboxylase/phosphopantothenate--cysteine ligase CoaBC [Gemmatimonadales bacterium]